MGSLHPYNYKLLTLVIPNTSIYSNLCPYRIIKDSIQNFNQIKKIIGICSVVYQ